MSNTHHLLDELASIEPALAQLHDEHSAEYGETLAHVLFGDFTRWIVEHAPATHVLDVLERHFAAGDANVDNLIAVSFLENLAPEDTFVREALGTRLSEQLAAMESWTHTGLEPPT